MTDKKKLTPLALVSIFFLMLALSFASVPLYDLFCRVTGFGGTSQDASNKEIPNIISFHPSILITIFQNVYKRLEIQHNKTNNEH